LEQYRNTLAGEFTDQEQRITALRGDAPDTMLPDFDHAARAAHAARDRALGSELETNTSPRTSIPTTQPTAMSTAAPSTPRPSITSKEGRIGPQSDREMLPVTGPVKAAQSSPTPVPTATAHKPIPSRRSCRSRQP
jgi:hypothetical protein